MATSKTSKVWLSGMGGGALTVVGGALLVTGVGTGAGAVLLTSGLATIGGVVGGGMLAGIGVLAAGSATAAAMAAALANKLIEDPELRDLRERLRRANELYAGSSRKTKEQEREIAELNKEIGRLGKSRKCDAEKLEQLKARLVVLIRQMQGESD